MGYQAPLEFWEEATAACWKVKPDLVMIDEGKPTEYLKTAFDSCYDFPWSFTIRRMIVSGTPGGKSPKHGTFAEKMDVIRKYEETAPENSRFFCFLDCHDTVLGDRERRFDRIRPVEEGNAAYVLVFLRRGIAVLYNGNEIADNGIGSIFMPNDRKRDRTRVNWARPAAFGEEAPRAYPCARKAEARESGVCRRYAGVGQGRRKARSARLRPRRKDLASPEKVSPCVVGEDLAY